MEATIAAANVKLFAKALQAMGKISTEMFIDVDGPDGINVQVLNAARSAFVIFRYTTRFFAQFKRTSGSPIKCAVQVKSCANVFRATSSVQKCDLVLDDTHLTFVLHCKLGVQKKYRINVEQSAVHKALYSKITPNRIVARPRTLQDCVQNFHSGIDEVTMVPSTLHLKLKSFTEVNSGADDGGGATRITGKAPDYLKTELVVDAHDFEQYSIKPDAAELTFSLKELRAILTFCEAAGQPVNVFFSIPGQPLLLSVNCYDSLTVDFVLATMTTAPLTPGDALSQPSGSAVSNLSSAQPFRRGYSPEPQVRNRMASNEDNDDDDDDDDEDDFVPGTPEREEMSAGAPAKRTKR